MFEGPQMNRRRFLGLSAAGAASVVAWPYLRGAQAAGAAGKARSVIVLYMAGGASQLDTFDPKPGRGTGGPFKTVDTAIKGVKFSEHLPRIAKEAGELAVIRSMSTGEGNHRRAAYLMRTGYAPAGPVQHPSLGAIVSKYRGQRDFPLPNFVAINNGSIGGGFLGVEHSPFVVNDPTRPVANLAAPEDVDRRRFQRRWELLKKTEERFAEGRRQDMVEGHRKVYERAERFMHSKYAKAFDVSLEKESLRAEYGSSRFGQGCLMARRLVEVGVPFVEVTLGGWDTHRDNFETVKNLSAQLDPAYAALIRDLKKRGLLDSTLVVWTGDFGRTPNMNATNGRNHFPRAWTTILSGGGVGRGLVLGDTGRDGQEAKGRLVSAEDLHATFAHLLELDRNQENISRSGRPISLVAKKGTVVKEIL